MAYMANGIQLEGFRSWHEYCCTSGICCKAAETACFPRPATTAEACWQRLWRGFI